MNKIIYTVNPLQARMQEFPEGGSSTRIASRASRGRDLGALSDPQKPRGIWSKILQSSNFKALHSNFRKVLFFKIQILHQLGFDQSQKRRL